MSEENKGDCRCSSKERSDICSKNFNGENKIGDVVDIWGDDDIEELQTSTADIKRMHTKQGYLDGISNAKESSLQDGFDDLYPKGARLGIAVGNILGALISHNDQDLFEKAKTELNISEVLHKKYFDENLELKDEQEPQVIAKWQEIVHNLGKN